MSKQLAEEYSYLKEEDKIIEKYFSSKDPDESLKQLEKILSGEFLLIFNQLKKDQSRFGYLINRICNLILSQVVDRRKALNKKTLLQKKAYYTEQIIEIIEKYLSQDLQDCLTYFIGVPVSRNGETVYVTQDSYNNQKEEDWVESCYQFFLLKIKNNRAISSGERGTEQERRQKLKTFLAHYPHLYEAYFSQDVTVQTYTRNQQYKEQEYNKSGQYAANLYKYLRSEIEKAKNDDLTPPKRKRYLGQKLNEILKLNLENRISDEYSFSHFLDRLFRELIIDENKNHYLLI